MIMSSSSSSSSSSSCFRRFIKFIIGSLLIMTMMTKTTTKRRGKIGIGIGGVMAAAAAAAEPDENKKEQQVKASSNASSKKSKEQKKKKKRELSVAALAAENVLRRYLFSTYAEHGFTFNDVVNMKTTDVVPSNGGKVQHVYMVQTMNDLRADNAVLNSNIQGNEILSTNVKLCVKNLQRVITSSTSSSTVAIPPSQAIQSAAKELVLPFAQLPNEQQKLQIVQPTKTNQADKETIYKQTNGLSKDDIPTRLCYYKVDDNDVRLAWNLVLRLENNEHWYNMWVDAHSSTVLFKSNWMSEQELYQFSAYELPIEAPVPIKFGEELDLTNIQPMTLAQISDTFWLFNGTDAFTHTQGNNAIAIYDPFGFGSQGLTGDVINATSITPSEITFDYRDEISNLLTDDPTLWKNAATTNLFYWNNIMRDVLYVYGFDEVSGNFQDSNFGLGGEEGDAVLAFAHEGSAINNARFGTPPDGQRGIMYQFLWYTQRNANIEIENVLYDAVMADFGIQTITFENTPIIDAGPMCIGPKQDYTGKIVIIERCNFDYDSETLIAELQGAIAVVWQSTFGDAFRMPRFLYGRGTVTIPSVMLSFDDGNNVRNLISQNADNGLDTIATLRTDTGIITDSSLDNGVISHEYCHGLTNRLTGGPSNSDCLQNAEQAGEGWSDFCSLFVTQTSDSDRTRTIGAYVTGSEEGVRPNPYSPDFNINSLTYASIVDLSVPHGIGTVWASCLWDLYWAFVDVLGYNQNIYDGQFNGGNNFVFQLMVDGLKFQTCFPNFVDSRNGIIQAVEVYGNLDYTCLVWQVFANRGLGVNAISNSQFFDIAPPIEDFNVPAECGGPTGSPTITPAPTPSTDPNFSCQGRESCNFDPTFACQCDAACINAGDCCPDSCLFCGVNCGPTSSPQPQPSTQAPIPSPIPPPSPTPPTTPSPIPPSPTTPKPTPPSAERVPPKLPQPKPQRKPYPSKKKKDQDKSKSKSSKAKRKRKRRGKRGKKPNKHVIAAAEGGEVVVEVEGEDNHGLPNVEEEEEEEEPTILINEKPPTTGTRDIPFPGGRDGSGSTNRKIPPPPPPAQRGRAPLSTMMKGGRLYIPPSEDV